ncbi:hypothetical protein FRC05_002297 [Tulasnella sp. 425]|nr:hypothetical protein FRC05_002297 [Tulasnella sp. 425]
MLLSMTTPPPKKLTAIPKIPQAFGEDGGLFYKYYDDIAEELDNDMVTSLKSQLDGILIFMSPDPTDDTNALLFQILLGGNSTIKSPADLPSATFSPTSNTFTINVLFSMSLTLALLGSFLAVLGQQWLVYYRKRSGGGAESQRWEQLRRYLGAKRWRLELVLDDVLPSVLQVGLVIFCVAFVLYLGTLSRSLCYAIAAPLCMAGAIIVMMAMCAAWDHWCPFKSPLSHLSQPIFKHSAETFGRIVRNLGWGGVTAMTWLVRRLGFGLGSPGFQLWRSNVWYHAGKIPQWFKQRPADATDQLQVIALKRVLCTSEDPDAIIHAAANMQSISQTQLLSQILNHDETWKRLVTVSNPSSWFEATTSERIQSTAVAHSLLHVVLMVGSVEDLLLYDDRSLLKDRASDPEYSNDWVEKVEVRINDLFFMGFDLEKDCAECSHCTFLNNSVELLWSIFSMDGRPKLIRIKPNHLERPIHVIGASKVIGPAWIEAWAITLSKEWDDLSGGEAELTPNSDVRNWQLKKTRDFLHLYRNIDVPKFVQTIYEAIATSTVQWCDQPEIEVYVGLLEQDFLVRGAVHDHHDYCLGSTLNSLATLLHSIERRIRDPATSSDERESQRKHRRTCTEKWIDYISNAYDLSKKSNMPEAIRVWRHGPLWYHCAEASATLQPYLQWMREIAQADPGNADNPPMIKMVTFLLGCLTDPEGAMRQIEDRPSYIGLEEKFFEEIIEEYRQFYPGFTKTVREIESAIIAAAPHSSEVEILETQSGQNNLRRQGKFSDISLEWWGN